MGQYLLVLISIEEANGFPSYLSLEVLKELNDPQWTKAEEIAPSTPLFL